MGQMPLLDRVLRCRYVLLTAVAVLMFVGGAANLEGDNDWQFFTWGSDVLFGQHYSFIRTSGSLDGSAPGGLHLYGNYPFLQIGPPALLLSKVLQVGPRDGLYVAGAITQSLALSSVYCLDRAFQRPGRRGPLAILIGGTLLTVVWGSLTHFTHLDDALTLAALSAALWALRAERWVTAGLLLGLSAASKPWAVVVLALVLAPPSGRARARTGVAAVASVAAFWAPFVLADLDTLQLGQVHLSISPSSALSVLDINRVPSPQVLRLAQLGGGLVLACLVVMKGGWSLAPLAAFSLRLLIEPSAYQYYATGLVLAALIADLGAVRARIPVLSCVATGGWLAVQVSTTARAASLIRMSDYLILLLAALLLTWKYRREPAAPSSALPGS